MKSTLHEVLQYRNHAVVHRFIETWDLPFGQAEELFIDMMKWLWLSACLERRSSAPPRLAVTQATKLIDEMWHTFILFTQDYHEFCDRYFGAYIHHRPTPREEYEAQISEYERDPEAYRARQQAAFLAQLELVDALLGEETLMKWYSDYLARYTDEFMMSIWRWSFSPYDTRVRTRVKLAPGKPPEEGPQASVSHARAG